MAKPSLAISPRALPWILLIVVAGLHALSVNKTPWDSRYVLPTALSLVRHGDADLEEYGERLRHDVYYGIEWVDGRAYSIFPLGPALLAAPFVGLVDGALRLTHQGSFEERLQAGGESDTEELLASLVVALAALLMFHIGRELGLSPARAFFLGLILAFATPMWSTASRALWQHGPSALLLTATLLLLVKGRLAWAGLPLALSFLMRPTNAIAIAVLSMLVVYQHRGAAWRFLAVQLGVALAIVAHDLAVYGSILPSYYLPGRIGEGPHFLEALAGNLLSPSRGLLVYTPLYLLALVEGARQIARGPRPRLAVAILVILLLHWLVISRFPIWWGGHCYGPRFLTDLSPLLVYLLVPALGRFGVSRPRDGLLVGLVVVSVAMHAVGAMVEPAPRWNRLPTDVNDDRERLWDWRDPPFLRWQDPTEESPVRP